MNRTKEVGTRYSLRDKNVTLSVTVLEDAIQIKYVQIKKSHQRHKEVLYMY